MLFCSGTFYHEGALAFCPEYDCLGSQFPYGPFYTGPLAADIPTARDQNELARLFAAPSAYTIVSYDGYFAVKPAILATLLSCFGASMPNTGPSSNSGSKNHDDDADDDDEEASQTGSLSRTC